MYPRPTNASYAGDYRFLIDFEDGLRAELDFSSMIRQGGLFEQLGDPEFFRQATIDPEAQTLTWPSGVDVCPDVLYHLATGAKLPGPLVRPPATLIRREQSAGAAS
jgi:hypothetical protein